MPVVVRLCHDRGRPPWIFAGIPTRVICRPLREARSGRTLTPSHPSLYAVVDACCFRQEDPDR